MRRGFGKDSICAKKEATGLLVEEAADKDNMAKGRLRMRGKDEDEGRREGRRRCRGICVGFETLNGKGRGLGGLSTRWGS